MWQHGIIGTLHLYFCVIECKRIKDHSSKFESIMSNVSFLKFVTLRWWFSWDMICSLRSALDEIFYSRGFTFISIPWVTFWTRKDHLLPMLSWQWTLVYLTDSVYFIRISKFSYTTTFQSIWPFKKWHVIK